MRHRLLLPKVTERDFRPLVLFQWHDLAIDVADGLLASICIFPDTEPIRTNCARCRGGTVSNGAESAFKDLGISEFRVSYRNERVWGKCWPGTNLSLRIRGGRGRAVAGQFPS